MKYKLIFYSYFFSCCRQIEYINNAVSLVVSKILSRKGSQSTLLLDFVEG